MSLWQKFQAWLGGEFVVLDLVIFGQLELRVQRARILGGRVYARTHEILSDTAVELLPGGGVDRGGCTIAWRPITPQTWKFYEEKES